MNPRARTLLRVLKRIISTLALLLLLCIIGTSIAAYLTVSGKSLALLRFAAARVGALVAGQRTHQLTVDLRLDPTQGRLTGTAAVTVESEQDSRQHFYFLLNDGLHVRGVRIVSAAKTALSASAYQLWLLTIVDTGVPVPKGSTVQLVFEYDGTPAAGIFSVTSNLFNPHQVLLNADSFWYPSDVQSFFNADVTVTLPASMTVVHNGTQAEQFDRGNLRQTRWSSERPVAGVALVAGRYNLSAKEADGFTYRLYLPPDVQLDPARVLGLMSDAHRALQDRYGASGFRQLTLFVDRNLRRGFNDGSGLMGLSIRHFRMGDYGFGTMAREIAHDWWGATVAGKWLAPGTGGEWLVEGLAEFSSVVASEAEYGAQALVRRRGEEFFDPDRHGVVAQMSALDNAIAEHTSRDTIYHKGAYVAMMLRRQLGDDAYFSGLRQFLERFRFQQATDRDLQQVLQESTEQDLKPFFTDWVRSDHLVDLSLDADSHSEITVGNLGSAGAAGDIELWTVGKGGGEAPRQTTVHVGQRMSVAAEGEYAVLDPLLVWADMQRENNRYPRAGAPLYVTASARGDLAVTRGEAFPWVRASVAQKAADGRTLHTWDFRRGLADPPSWAPDGSRLVASYSESPDSLPAVVTLAAEGAQRTIGYGATPAAAADGGIYAASHDRIIRFEPGGSETVVVRRRGESLERPVPSPDAARIVYTAARGNQAELRVVNRDGGNDRPLLSWDRDRMLYRWSPDGTHVFAIIGGEWDWRIWDIPLGSGSTATLVAGAAAIADLALSPDGTRIAFTAAPELDYPNNRCRLYLLDLADRSVRTIDIPDADLGALTWVADDAIVVVATKADPDQRWSLPASRSLKRVRLPEGSVQDEGGT
jgi:hypothetical protein